MTDIDKPQSQGGVTYEDVALACAALKREGAKVTVRGVRSILKTGSMQKLMEFIGRWKAAEELSLVVVIEQLRAELGRTQAELAQAKAELIKIKKRVDPEIPY